jgi:hypothetical protein
LPTTARRHPDTACMTSASPRFLDAARHTCGYAMGGHSTTCWDLSLHCCVSILPSKLTALWQLLHSVVSPWLCSTWTRTIAPRSTRINWPSPAQISTSPGVATGHRKTP